MSRKSNAQKKKLFRVFVQYGFHLWLLIFLTNIIVFYSFRFFTRASNNATPNEPEEILNLTLTPFLSKPTDIPILALGENELSSEDISESPTPTDVSLVEKPSATPFPTPVGQVLNLSFTMPGISSTGGNIKPLNTVRNLIVLLYDPDANTADKKVKPLYAVRSTITYDSDPNSPTYTSFVNRFIDLGEEVKKDKVYQIAFKTDQTLVQLVKAKDSKSVGGDKFEFKKRGIISLPPQEPISGDIYPHPETDNIMDAKDFKMLTDCYGEKAFSENCPSPSAADLNDDGVVDGGDYNIMFVNFLTLKEKGQPAPKVKTSPTKTPASTKDKDKNISPTHTSSQAAMLKNKSGGGTGGLVIFFVILIILGGGGFAAFRMHLLDVLLKKMPKGIPFLKAKPGVKSQESPQLAGTDEISPSDNSGLPKAGDQTSELSNPAAQTPNPGSQPVQNQTSENVKTAGQAELPQEQPQTTETKNDNPKSPIIDQGKNAADLKTSDTTTTTSTVFESKGSSPEMVEKSGYLKKVSADESGSGVWVTLADDSGINRGFFEGKDVADGFVKIKGTSQLDKENKTYILISEITPEVSG
jgi:hypothetical protein